MIHEVIEQKSLKVIEEKYTHILVIVDAFTGYLTLFLLKEVTTKVITQCIFKYVTIHLISVEIVTDEGPKFQKELLADLMKIWSMHHLKVSLKTIKKNGKIEVSYKIVKNMIRTLIRKYEKKLKFASFNGGICIQHPKTFCYRVQTFYSAV